LQGIYFFRFKTILLAVLAAAFFDDDFSLFRFKAVADFLTLAVVLRTAMGILSAIFFAFAPATPPTTAPTAAPIGPTIDPAAAPAAAPPTIPKPDIEPDVFAFLAVTIGCSF
jgi:hypothetical protein